MPPLSSFRGAGEAAMKTSNDDAAILRETQRRRAEGEVLA